MDMKISNAQRKRDVLRCHICSEEFDMVSAIRRHYTEQHPGMKPFACESCGKRFDRKENLNRHVRIHTGDRRYICNHCGKGYTDPSGLKKHVLSKHSDIHYPCNVCNANFKSKDSLNRHLTKHLTEMKNKKDNDYNGLTTLDGNTGQSIKVFIQDPNDKSLTKNNISRNMLTSEEEEEISHGDSDKGLEQLQGVIQLQQYADSGAVQVQYIQVAHDESYDKERSITSSAEQQNLVIAAQVMSTSPLTEQAMSMNTQAVTTQLNRLDPTST